MIDLNGKRGIITGASSGIGFASANVLAGAGASVIAISRSGAPKNSEDKSNPGVEHVKADITDFVRMSEVIAQISAGGGIDFLINNAGITVKKRAEDLTAEEFEHVHRVNVFAAFELLSAYAEARLEKRFRALKMIGELSG